LLPVLLDKLEAISSGVAFFIFFFLNVPFSSVFYYIVNVVVGEELKKED
jgi:hypothetical protein